MRTLKILLALTAVMICTGLKAADTLSVRDLTYRTLTIYTGNITFHDSLTYNDAVLADYNEDAYAKGYKLVVTQPVYVDMKAVCGVDTYSYLFTEEFEELNHNDDYDGDNTGYCMVMQPGVYYWVVTPYNVGIANVGITISIRLINAVSVQNLLYMSMNFNDTVENAVTANDPVLLNVREGCCVQGYTFTINGNEYNGVDISLNITNQNWDVYMYLLDEAYNIVASIDGRYGGCRICRALNEGVYYVIVTQYDKDDFGSYRLTLQGKHICSYSDITYVPVAPDTTLGDSISINSDIVQLPFNSEIVSANGYAVTLLQGDVVQINAESDYNMNMLVTDENFKPLYYSALPDYYGFRFKAEQAGTYYVLAISTYYQTYNMSFTLRNEWNNNTYYVDAVNGSNSNDGTTAQTPLATLDYALSAKLSPQDGAVIYLMSDVKLIRPDHLVSNGTVRIIPYEGRHITISSDTYMHLSFSYSYVEIGHKDSGTITFADIADPNGQFMFVSRGNLVLHNVNINNVNTRNIVNAQESHIELNNCNIENNTITSSVISGIGSVQCNNSRIAYNKCESVFLLMQCIGELNNTHITGNQSDRPSVFAQKSTLSVNNCVLDSNESGFAESYNVPNAVLTRENVGGIISVMSALHINGSTTMHNNYVMLVNGDVITVDSVINTEKAGVVLPVYMPDMIESIRAVKVRRDVGIHFDYYEGKPILAGNVYANYKRFNLYQPDADTTWYIISDGTLAKQEDVAVAVAAQAQVSIYPNPTSGMLYIHTQGSEATSIRLADMQGRIICNQNVENESVQLNMQSLAHGMYFVQIMSKEGVLATRKVVKK